VKEPLPELPCPRCGHADTLPVRRFGYPLAGEKPGTSRWQCTSCGRQFDGPKVRR
jgi:transposase-like protein